MSKFVRSVRMDPDTLRKLEVHNAIRVRCGWRSVTLGSILDEAVSLWIERDRSRIRSDAQRVLDELEG